MIALMIASGTAAAQKDGGLVERGLEHVDIDPDAWLQSIGSLFDRLEAASPVLTDVARGAFRRARRKVSLGPTLGAFGAFADDATAALTFGIGVEVFKIPVLPTVDNLKVILRERAKAKLKLAIIDTLKGAPPDQATIERFAADAWAEAVKEILGMENIRARTMERPQFTLALEGNRYFDASTWATRLRLGTGVWKVTLAASLGLGFTEPRTSAYVGPEIVLHFLTSKGPRASVVDVVVRADFEVRGRGEAYSQDVYSLGVRYLLDII